MRRIHRQIFFEKLKNVLTVSIGTFALLGLTYGTGEVLKVTSSFSLPAFERDFEYAQAQEFDPVPDPVSEQLPTRSKGKIDSMSFQDLEFTAAGNSVLRFTEDSLVAPTDSCIALSYVEVSEQCWATFVPANSITLPKSNAILKSFTLEAEIQRDSELIIEHINGAGEFVQSIGKLTQSKRWGEFNFPRNMAPNDTIRVIFWNKGNPQSGSGSGGGSGGSSSRGVYCTAQFNTTSQWGSGYVGTITLTNMTQNAISPWELAFSLPASVRVSSMWNGMHNSQGSNHTVRSMDYNRILDPGSSVEIGFITNVRGSLQFPSGFAVNGQQCNSEVDLPSQSPAVSCEAVYRITQDWGNGFGGEIILKNTGSSPIVDWDLEFAFDSDQTIVQSWGGEFTQNDRAVLISTAPYNRLIDPGRDVRIGFNAWYSQKNSEPRQFVVNQNICGGSPQSEREYGISLMKPSFDYLDIDNLQIVSIKIDTSKYAISSVSSGIVYFDTNRNQSIDPAIDIQWSCRESFPGVLVQLDSDGIAHLVRDDQCYTGQIASAWNKQDVALPKGDWIISFDNGNVIIPFVIPDEEVSFRNINL